MSVWLLTYAAQAFERVVYGTNPPPYLSFEDTSPYRWAAVDLNDDGLSEYILRPKKCLDTNTACAHKIIGFTPQGQTSLLGIIKTRDILLGVGYSGTVRNLLARNNPLNDYHFDVYMWSPNQSQYVRQESLP